MSLATLARKTRTKKRMNTRGKFILNMTGRGNVLGMNAKMSRGNCKGLTKCAGKRAACCVGVGGDASGCCRFPHGGKPAPQMGYGVYLNRKSKGAYHPGGGKQCKTLPGCQSAKTVWKQGSNLDASVVITNKKDNVLACNSDVYTAKRDTCTGCTCSSYSTITIKGDLVGGDASVFVVGTVMTQNGDGFKGTITANNGSDIESLLSLTLKGDERACNDTSSPYTFGGKTATGGDTTGPYYESNLDTAQVTNESKFVCVLPDGSILLPGYGGAFAAAYTSASANPLSTILDGPGSSEPTTCCCPVKKSICGCRSTDVLRYTRINKSFGCQTTKAVRMGRSASEQIARRRAAVDCIKPTHRTIHLSAGQSTLSFDGCCGNQCLIPGQQYTFVINNLYSQQSFTIVWCEGIIDTFTAKLGVTSVSFTVPKFNNSSNCIAPTHASISSGQGASIILDYCKEAFKKPQMRSC